MPAGARRVDLSGKTVIPALIDAHSHIGYMKDLTSGPQNYTRENILDHMHRFAYFGVAASQAMGSDFGELPFAIRDELMAGKAPDAARFLTAGRGLAPLQEISAANMRHAAYAVTTVEGARASVAELAQRKVDAHQNVGGRSRRNDHADGAGAVPSDHRRGAPARYARRRARYRSPDAKNLLRAGIDVFAHMISDVDDELLALFKQHPNTVVLTALGGPRRIVSAPWLNPPHPLVARDRCLRSRSRACRIGSRVRRRRPRSRQRQAWERLARGLQLLAEAGVHDRHRHRRRRTNWRSVRRLDDAHGAREPRERRVDAGAGADSRHAHGGRGVRARRSRHRCRRARARISWCSMQILSTTSRTRAGSHRFSCAAARSIARSCARMDKRISLSVVRRSSRGGTIYA